MRFLHVSGGSGQPKKLDERIDHLSREVEKLEGVVKGAVAHEDLGEASLSLRHLRASLVQPELIEKRELLADLRAKAATLASERRQNRSAPGWWTRRRAKAATLASERGQKRTHINGFFKISAERREGARSFRNSLGWCTRFPAVRFAHLAVRFALLTVSFALLLLFVVLSHIPLNLSMIGAPFGMAPAPTIANNSIELAPAINEPVGERGEAFFVRDVKFDVAERDRVILSGYPSPTAEFSVDDRMELSVRHPDGSTASWSRVFNVDCFANEPTAALDVTELFLPGVNTVTISLYDSCGSRRGTSAPIVLTKAIGEPG